MLHVLLGRDIPPPVHDDLAVQETEQEWKAAQAAVETLAPRYARLKVLVNQPANATLSDLGATPEEQDEAFGTFPALAAQYHEATLTERRARAARDAAHERAYRARQAWYEDRLRQIEDHLVELISGPVYDRVREIHALMDEAASEEIPIRVEPTRFGDVPLRIGDSRQGGLESVIPTLRALVKKA
jgi:hypothetical protein